MVELSPDATDYTTVDLTAEDILASDGTLSTEVAGPGSGSDVAGQFVGSSLRLLEQLFSSMGIVARELDVVLRQIDYSHLPRVIEAVGGYIEHAVEVFDIVTLVSWRFVSQFTPQAGFLREMITLGLGVDTEQFDEDGAAAIQVADSMIGFAVALQYIAASVSVIGKLPLANRMPSGLWKTIEKLPEEFGLTWALGLTIEKAFETAVGTQLERNIWRQKRPNEPEWNIARMMLRQHVIDDDALTEILENSGFSEKWIARIRKLETQPLPIGDVQGLYQSKLIDDVQVKTFINQLGFTDEIAALLKTLYVDKAETTAGAELRATARMLYRNNQLSQDDYRTILTDTHFPDRLIDEDIKAVELEHSVGWKQQSIAVVKSQLIHATITFDAAVLKIVNLGYSKDNATDLVKSWQAPPIRRQHGLSQSEVLRYFVAGLLDKTAAQTQLQALGVAPDTINFLIDHPTASAGVHHLRLTPALVTQAYLVGAIQDSDLPDAFKKAGAGDETIDYLIAQARYKYAHHHIPGSGTTPLTVGDVKSAFKLGLFDEPTALNWLMELGYSQQNALLLLEIENKGPIQPPQAPAFPSLQAAMAYLEQYGYTFQYPPDPQWEAAVQQVEAAGITPIPPTGFIPPYGHTGFVGSGPPLSPPPTGTGGTAPVISGP